MSKIEYRQAARMGGELRATEINGVPGVTLHAIKPGAVDDFGSLWMADTFDESLARRMPVLCWAHDWSEPLGSGVDHVVGPEGPDVRFVFDNFDAVPRAKQAYAQIQPKEDGSPPTIQDCSVGFTNTKRRDPTDAEVRQYPGVREVIEKADLDEISLVMRGAVPGAKVLAVRSARAAGGTVAVDDAVELAKRVAAGEITHEEAKAALALLATDDDTGDGGDDEVVVPPEPTLEEVAAAEAAATDLADAEAEADVADLLVGRSR